VPTAFQQAGKVAGVNTKVINGQGVVPDIDAGFSQAIAHHANGIVLFAVALNTVATELKAAKAAGIPVVDTFNSDDGQNLTSQGIFGHVSEDATAAGKMVADWMLDYTGCKLDTAILGGKVITPHALSAAGAQKEISTLCGSACKSEFINLNLSQLVSDSQTQAQEAVRRDPNINILYSCFDAAVPYIESGLKQSGTSNVKIISQDGTTPSIDYIRSGTNPQIADVALPPSNYIGWLYMDQILRAMAGAAPANGILPFRLLDPTNIGTASTNLFPEFAGFEGKFKSIWGVTG
jgi:ribose transport system substrate-binding protein